MIKQQELADATSCLNRAEDDEPVFVLLARDANAPSTIYEWINKRLRSGANDEDDDQIQEAFVLADLMKAWRLAHRP